MLQKGVYNSILSCFKNVDGIINAAKTKQSYIYFVARINTCQIKKREQCH